MENLNNLIWTDEDDSNDIQPLGIENMKEKCLVAFCLITMGSSYVCSSIDAAFSTAPAICSLS